MSKYTIEFELPDNDTVLNEIGIANVHWMVWGYSGTAKVKPSVDIVRCKDCKYWHVGEYECTECLADVPRGCTEADDYCSYGEEKENE